MFIPLPILVTLTLAIGVAFLYILVLRDPGSFIFAMRDDAMLKRVLNVVDATAKKRPAFDASTKSVERALFMSGLIINTSSAEVLARLGGSNAAMAFVVKHPESLAFTAAQMLRDAGCVAKVVADFDPEIPKGKMSAVICPDLGGIAIIFRVHKMKMGPPPPRWKG